MSERDPPFLRQVRRATGRSRNRSAGRARFSPRPARMRDSKRPLPPARPRRVRRGRAAHRPRHRHRADARRVRDDRARARPAHRHVPRAALRRATCASSRARGAGLRHRRRHGHGQDARHPADRRGDPRHDDAARRRDQPRARGDARDADAGTSSSSRPASRAAGSRTATSSPHDTLVVDEIHQTSAELELCLALGKRVGCRFIWLSATVDPTFYARYLDSRRRARGVRVRPAEGGEGEGGEQGADASSSTTGSCSRSYKQQRGVALFLPTRAGVEQAAELRAASAARASTPRSITAASRSACIRPFLEGGEHKPYFLAMTAAGQSALNVQGLDTVVIDDTRFTNVVERGQERAHAAAPRRQRDPADGGARARARRGRARVHPQRPRHRLLRAASPTAPEFQLAGDSERVAITCADLGVRAGRARAAGPARPRRLPARDRSPRVARHHRERDG